VITKYRITLHFEPYDKLAKIYDKIFSDNQFYAKYYNFLTQIMKKKELKPNQILEIACGTGILSKYFIDNGYMVEGLDISENMLNAAREKGLKTYKADMTCFDLKKKYDVILCVFDSVNYIQTQSKMLSFFESVYNHLDKDGLFVFDMNSDYKINELVPKMGNEYHVVDDIESIWLNSHEEDTWICKMIFYEKIGDDLYQRYSEEHREKAYLLNTVLNLLHQANINSIEIYSDFNYNLPKNDSSRWFFICSK
jgi:SAM-dependent methyltransferase